MMTGPMVVMIRRYGMQVWIALQRLDECYLIDLAAGVWLMVIVMSKLPNVWICRTVHTYRHDAQTSALWWDWCNSKLPNARFCRNASTDRHDDYAVDTIQNCRISEYVKLFTCVDIMWKTETGRMPEPVNLFTHIGTAGLHEAMGNAFIKTPNLQTVNILLAQWYFEHQTSKRSNDPETSICETFTMPMDTSMPGVEFWRTEIRNNCEMHKANGKQQYAALAGQHVATHILTVGKTKTFSCTARQDGVGHVQGSHQYFAFKRIKLSTTTTIASCRSMRLAELRGA